MNAPNELQPNDATFVRCVPSAVGRRDLAPRIREAPCLAREPDFSLRVDALEEHFDFLIHVEDVAR